MSESKVVYVVGHAMAKGLKIKKGDIRKVGEPIPECVNWKPNVLQSHLSLKWIVTEEEYKIRDAAEKERIARLKKSREEDKKRRAERSTEALEKGAAEEGSVESEGNEDGQVSGDAGEGEGEDSGTIVENGEDVASNSEESDAEGDDESGDNSEEGEEESGEVKPALDLEGMGKPELMELAKSLGLAVRGNKEEIKARIIAHNEAE